MYGAANQFFNTSNGEPVCVANGRSQAVDTAIVCGPHDPNRFRSAKIENWLRRLARGGPRLGAPL